MAVHEPQAAPADVPFDETGVKRELGGVAAQVLAAVALAFSTYQPKSGGYPLAGSAAASLKGPMVGAMRSLT